MNDKIKKQNRFRLIIQAISFAFHNGYVIGWVRGGLYQGANKEFCVPGLNCYSCPGAIGACPIGSLQAALNNHSFKAVLYIVGAIGALGILFGRLICGWLCPFGWVQDLMYKIPLFKKEKNLPRHGYLKYLKYAVLALLVILLPVAVIRSGVGQPWFCEWLCPSGTLLGGIPQVIGNENLRSAIGFRFFLKLAILLAILLLSVKFARPFCKYLCPLGALYGFCNPVSTYRLKVSKESCIECGACRKACPMDISTWKDPNSMECIRCGNCMAACPTGSVTSTWKMLLGGKNEMPETVQEEEKPANGRKIAAMILAELVAFFGILLACSRLSMQITCGDGLDLGQLFPVIANCVTQIMLYYLMIMFALRVGKSLRTRGMEAEIRDLSAKLLRWTLILRIGVSAVSFFLYSVRELDSIGDILINTVGLFVYFRISILVPLLAVFVIWLLCRDWRKKEKNG